MTFDVLPVSTLKQIHRPHKAFRQHNRLTSISKREGVTLHGLESRFIGGAI
jgi:hypothetical protein